MKKLLCLALASMVATSVSPLSAQIFRRRPVAGNPAQRVPELIVTLRTDQDSRQRARAAEDLQHFDPGIFAEIVPALAAAAEKDDSVGVRLEAITSLGRLRPVNEAAGSTLARIADHENHLRVRLHAKATLFWYQRAGYAGRTDSGSIAPVAGKETKDITIPAPLPQGPAGIVVETEYPPERTVLPALKAADSGEQALPRPLPRGTPFSTAVPQQPIIITRPTDPSERRENIAPPPPPAGKSDF